MSSLIQALVWIIIFVKWDLLAKAVILNVSETSLWHHNTSVHLWRLRKKDRGMGFIEQTQLYSILCFSFKLSFPGYTVSDKWYWARCFLTDKSDRSGEGASQRQQNKDASFSWFQTLSEQMFHFGILDSAAAFDPAWRPEDGWRGFVWFPMLWSYIQSCAGLFHNDTTWTQIKISMSVTYCVTTEKSMWWDQIGIM